MLPLQTALADKADDEVKAICKMQNSESWVGCACNDTETVQVSLFAVATQREL